MDARARRPVPRKIMSKWRTRGVAAATSGTPSMMSAGLMAYMLPKGASHPIARGVNSHNTTTRFRAQLKGSTEGNTCFSLVVDDKTDELRRVIVMV